MEFGIQFFPAVGPDQKPAEQYWREALELTQLAEQLGFTNVRTVEHYFLSYGGYSSAHLSQRRRGVDALDAPDHWCGAAGVQ
jgi:alkanesulfonate monooxygenase SsuD/methylene tetrahydromethanopterin reductase-like flavin-dependent oxidoreductase (luciferase family)